MQAKTNPNPLLTVVVPVFNESASLQALFGRLHATYARAATIPSLGELKAPTGYIME